MVCSRQRDQKDERRQYFRSGIAAVHGARAAAPTIEDDVMHLLASLPVQDAATQRADAINHCDARNTRSSFTQPTGMEKRRFIIR